MRLNCLRLFDPEQIVAVERTMAALTKIVSAAIICLSQCASLRIIAQ